MLQRVNLFTADLEALFKLKGEELSIELEALEKDFKKFYSFRAASLLTWFYLIGNYESPQETKDWEKSFYYLK